MSDGLHDPFAADGLRGRVLDAWAASPARFREDANAEEDYALGGYRDRVVVELAQNAADAAARAGVPGRLRLTLRDGTLVAANTGAPLDAAGVEALSTLRASSKRDTVAVDGTIDGSADVTAPGTVGRFGVGFAAVVAVSDEPRIRSTTGAVGWSLTRARELVGAIPALAGELAARGGHVPLLRLPFALAGDRLGGSYLAGTDRAGSDHPGSDLVENGPEGFATAVELPLRDGASVDLVTRLLAEVGPALLLALPALAEVVIETDESARVLTAVHAADAVTITVDGAVSRWRVAGAGGVLEPALLADRPTEERARTIWSVRWAVPVDGSGRPIALKVQPVIAGQSFSANGRAETADAVRAARDAVGWGGDAADAVGNGLGSAGNAAGAVGNAGGSGGNTVGAVVYAPTPTDEPLGLPALLLASFPLSPDRRHVAPGPLTDFLIERAADAYAGMLPRLAPGPGLLDLVPGPVGRGELDARLSRAIASRLPDVAFLPTVADAATAADAAAVADAATVEPGTVAGRVRPRDALLLSGDAPGLAEWLAPVLPNLVAGPARHPAFAVLGVRRLPLAELADLLASLDREPTWWRGLYAALAGGSSEEMAELGALPVPLADGRLVRGPRGLLLPGPGLDHPDRLAVLGLRVVAPDAAHPLLGRLGAVEATPRSVLDDAATRAAVAASYDNAAEASYDDDGPERVADAVLGLVAALNAEPGEYPYLADLALPGDDGDWYPAGELLLPGSPLAEVIAPDGPFGTIDQATLERHGAQALEAVGVHFSFGLLAAEEVELDESAIDLDLDGAGDWAADSRARIGGGTELSTDGDAHGYGPTGQPGLGQRGLSYGSLPPLALEVVAVRDLDLVDPARWPQALELLARPPLRAALIEPTRVRLADGRHADVPSYTAWWLRTHLELDGRRPGDLRTPDSDPLLAGLYDAISPGLEAASGSAGAGATGTRQDSGHPDADDATVGAETAAPTLAQALADLLIARALGVRTSLAELLAEPGGPDELLTRLADPARPVARPQLRALWAALATADALTPELIAPPEQVRAVVGADVVVADADDVLVLDAPDLWPLLADQPLVLVPYRLATRLAELLDLPLASEEIAGTLDSNGELRTVPEIVAAVLPGAPARYHAHDKLTVDGIELGWRYLNGEIHAATPAGVASALAWQAGRWPLRQLLTALLTSPDATANLLADADLDPL